MTGPAQGARLGLWSGVGLVFANMVGAGVLTSIGFMVVFNGLGPREIMLAWLVGGVLALLGARTYAEAARLMPRSGGEYRYLSELWHPALGAFAGWTSLLVGFAPPVAADALGVGAFAGALGVPLGTEVTGTVLVVLVTALHVIGLSASRRTQNVLVAIKVCLVVGIAVVGLAIGQHAFPSWTPTREAPGFPVDGFVVSLFFIAFCYSGWNAAIYAADDFVNPRRDVPRAMLLGCALVMGLYLVLNFVFLANLTPNDFGGWVSGDTRTITVGHLLMQHLSGPVGATVMSAFMIIVLSSAASAMTMIGPRVYAAMAQDGHLPRAFAGRQGRPPLGATLLQSALAIALVWTVSFREILEGVGVILTINAALVALGLVAARFRASFADRRPSLAAVGAASLFAASAVLLIVGGVKAGKISRMTFVWVGAIVALTAIAYVVTLVRRRQGGATVG